jgi:hypothetical protein
MLESGSFCRFASPEERTGPVLWETALLSFLKSG